MCNCRGLSLLLCLFVLFGATGGAYAQAGTLLRYHQSAGDLAIYDSTAVSHIVRPSESEPTKLEMDCTSLHFRGGAKFLGTSPEGLIQIELVEGSLEAMVENGNTALAAIMKQPASEEKELTTFSVRDELPEDDVSGGHSTNDILVLSGVGVLPEGPVATGNTWDGKVRFPQWGEEAHKKSWWRYHSQIIGTDFYGGRMCYKIRTTLSLDSLDASNLKKVQGVFAAEWLFDPELGLIAKADMSGAIIATSTSGRDTTITYHNNVKLVEYNGQKLDAE